MRLKASPENFPERIALSFNLAPVPLLDTQIAFTKARVIMAAAELGIFDAIGKNTLTASEVSKSCGTDLHATTQLLNCLVGFSYLKWNEGSYSLKPKMHKWLLRESPSCITDKLKFQLIEWNWVAEMENYVKTGKSMSLHEVITPSEWASYQKGMRATATDNAAEIAKKLKPKPGAVQMLDIGGSHGLYSIEICKRNPSLSCTILELPGAMEQAQKIAIANGKPDSIQYKAGNVLTDDLGSEQYDLVMINNVVHHFTVEQNRQLAKKIARALKPGGLFAIGEFIRQHKPGAGGEVPSALGIYFSMISASGNWSMKEMQSWQEEAGLKVLKPISLMTLPGFKMIVAEK